MKHVMGVFLLGLLAVPPAAAQKTTSGAEDAAVLLEAKAAADTSACTQDNNDRPGSTLVHAPIIGWHYPPYDTETCFDSWTPDTEPCGDGYDDYRRGWVGVVCNARGGRVVGMDLERTGVGGELLPFFGRLGALLVLRLRRNPALRGDVADLAGAEELRLLGLYNCPLVVGEAAALAALVHLGEEYTEPTSEPCSCTATEYDDCSWCVDGLRTRGGDLYLAGSGVHGPAVALRALPGLGADWDDFSPCSDFVGCVAAGLSQVDARASVAGIDECACCVGSPKARATEMPWAGVCLGGGNELPELRAADKATLLEAKAAADTSTCTCTSYVCQLWPQHESHASVPCPIDTWTAATEPCGYGYENRFRGWLGLQCDARGGRVVAVELTGTGVGGGLLRFFGTLGALLRLSLGNNPALRGDVADLAGATELRSLGLSGCPLVVGETAVLAALVHLGADYTVPDGSDGSTRTRTGGLGLTDSGVHGAVAALRALPGLGADWSGFTPCSAFGGQQQGQSTDTSGNIHYHSWGTGSPGCGLTPVAVSRNLPPNCAGLLVRGAALNNESLQDAASVAGTDHCACCGSDAPRGHLDSGACCPASGCRVDCAGTWSDCTAACETAQQRVWSESVAQRGQGAACPSAPPCSAGEGDCSPDIKLQSSSAYDPSVAAWALGAALAAHMGL